MNAKIAYLPTPITGVAVVKRTWVDGADSDPPRLEVELSNGAFVLVGYDTQYHCRCLFYAKDESADFVSCVSGDTQLHPDVLAALVDEVETATRSFESNHRGEYLSDAMSFEDGR